MGQVARKVVESLSLKFKKHVGVALRDRICGHGRDGLGSD